MNCSGIQSFLFGVILQTAVIVAQYTFWQFLTPVSSSFVRNPGLASALDKALANIQNSISNHLNPENTIGTSPLALDTEETSTPQMQFAVQVDNTRHVKTVCVWIQVKNLKIAFVEQTLTRLKQYVATAVLDAYE